MLISPTEADSKAFAMSGSPKASFGSIDNDHAHNMAVLQQHPHQQQLTIAAAANATQNAAVKRKRNLPGTPDPDAEIIALSPKTLMASNRFVCEVCNKGFQREQNLQLHRRGHNLPWKLRQRTTKEIRRRVYLCPEPTCVHHDPSRALGDLTGIKKHFCRKHGEKKWKCDKCAKRYAVQSDWKAHSKTCGTREYRCDCGTLFSRRDSFITHRAFCDALAEESARIPGGITVGAHLYNNSNVLGLGQAGSPMSIIAAQNSANSFRPTPASLNQGGISNSSVLFSQSARSMQGILGSSEYDDNSQGIIQKSLSGLMLPAMTPSNNSASFYSNLFTASGSPVCQLPAMQNSASSTLQESEGISGVADFTTHANSPATGMLTGNIINTHDGGISMPNVSTLYGQQQHGHGITTTAQMSATALLQKAAQMGSTTNNSSLLRGFAGMASSDINSMTSVGMGISNSWQLGPSAQDQQQRGSGMIINSTAGNNMVPNLVRSHSFSSKGSMDHITRGPTGNSLVNLARSFSGNSRSLENEGLQDLMNSLAGGGSSHAMQFGSLNNNSMQSAHAFGGNIGDSAGSTFGGFRVIAESLRPNDHNIGISDHHHNQQNHLPQTMQGGLSNLSMLPAGMLNHPRSHDQDSPCGDRLTRDFLGVGVASGNNMVSISAGGLRTQHAACNNNIISLDSDTNSAFQRDQNLR